MKRLVTFFYVILFVYFFVSAALASTHVASDQDKTPREKLSVGEVTAAEVTVENLHEAPLIKSPEETSNSEKSLTPSREESPDIKMRDAPAGAEDEEEIIAEEGQGDEKQSLLDTALEFYQASQELWSRGELEEAIAALDEAYSFILQVNSESDPAMMQEKEDLRILISKRLIEIYASRYSTVNGSHKAIPLTINEHVEYEIKQFQTVERDFFINSYKRSGRYIDKIVKELNEAGLPEELAWLPLVESGFNEKALSPARALGLWQFIASTGYKFGLKRDDWIDEGLPRETARYVPRFLATLHILKESEQYGFDLGETEEPLSFEVVTIEKQVGLGAIAKALGISEAFLSDLNPELRLKVTPPPPYSLRIPPAMSEA